MVHKEALNPEKIWQDYENGRLNKANAVNSLSLLIETSNSAEIRKSSLEMFEKLKVASEKVFKILEDCLISDKEPLIRATAAKIITSRFPLRSSKPLIWSMQNDQSPLVVKTLFELSECGKNPEFASIKEQRIEELSNFYGVVPSEAQFFLDSQIINGDTEIEVFKRRFIKFADTTPPDKPSFDYTLRDWKNQKDTDIYRDHPPTYVVKNERVISLTFHGVICGDLPDSIGLLSNLKYLYVYGVKKIPESIGSLRNLKTLRIKCRKSDNVILPETLLYLKTLKKLYLNYFGFYPVPEIVHSFVKKTFVKKYVQKGVLPDEALVLGLLEVFFWEQFYYVGKPPMEQPWNVHLSYKINEKGHIAKLNIDGLEDFDIFSSGNNSKHPAVIIPEPIFSLKYLEELRIHNVKINTIQNKIGELKFLRVLDLSGNRIQKIPESIKDLRSLKVLELPYNLIKTVSESIKSLMLLEILNLNNNRFENFPESITTLISLKSLDLSENKIQEIPESISRLKNLEHLHLYSNQIKTLPESIAALASLEALYLNNNRFEKFPKSVTTLISLKDLNLSGNVIQEIPESIAALTSLEALYLSNNRFEKFPKSVTTLISLKTLILSGNVIQEIPESIAALTSLEALFLSNNRFEKFPKSVTTLISLNTLILSGNVIQEIPESLLRLKNLKHLDLSVAYIKYVPESIKSCPALLNAFQYVKKIEKK